MFKIAEILSSTYKIEHFSRFLGQNTHFNMFLDILNRFFKGVYVPKNTFFEGTKKFFMCKKIIGTFCTCTKVACAKKTLFICR